MSLQIKYLSKNKSYNKPITLFIITFIFINFGCSKYIMLRMGIKNPKFRTQQEIQKFAKNNIFSPGEFLTQNNNFYNYFNTKDSIAKANDSNALDSFKAFIQPLQALYFDSLNNLKSVLINCYAEQVGYNLNWNTENRLNYFPPLSHTDLYSNIHPVDILKLTNINLDQLKKGDESYTVIVFWNMFLNKQTINFLKAIQDNLKRSVKPIKVYYINNDNSFFNN
jgi:hypothetical protein